MTSFAADLLSLLGKHEEEKETEIILNKYNLKDIFDDPPSRRYIGSNEKGVDVLFENNKVFDIQIFVKKSNDHSAFEGELPFGLKNNMTQQDVHRVLGDPESFDEFDSQYSLKNPIIRLTVAYDRSGILRYISCCT
ncbi:hypothetical protein ACO0LL_21395 [Undibacterium sp. TC4M20W]|uniref:hypothetical protein n=1 Tax=Undibacterium sp. TC4M20W TaxID=3413052 RepID=UPI003BF1F0B1